MIYLIYSCYMVMLFLVMIGLISLIEEYDANKSVKFKSWKRRFCNLLRSKFL